VSCPTFICFHTKSAFGWPYSHWATIWLSLAPQYPTHEVTVPYLPQRTENEMITALSCPAAGAAEFTQPTAANVCPAAPEGEAYVPEIRPLPALNDVMVSVEPSSLTQIPSGFAQVGNGADRLGRLITRSGKATRQERSLAAFRVVHSDSLEFAHLDRRLREMSADIRKLFQPALPESLLPQRINPVSARKALSEFCQSRTP
jgi:hypothetical protein